MMCAARADSLKQPRFALMAIGVLLLLSPGCRSVSSSSRTASSPNDLPTLMQGMVPDDGIYWDQWRVVRYTDRERPVVLYRLTIYESGAYLIARSCELIDREEASVVVQVFELDGTFIEGRDWYRIGRGPGQWSRSVPEGDLMVIEIGGERIERPLARSDIWLPYEWLPLVIRHHVRLGSAAYFVRMGGGLHPGYTQSYRTLYASRVGYTVIDGTADRVESLAYVVSKPIDSDERDHPYRLAEHWYVGMNGVTALMQGPGNEEDRPVLFEDIPETFSLPPVFLDLQEIGGPLP